MNIILIGYGKMGKEIHQIASKRGHEIVKIIDHSTKLEISKLKNSTIKIDVAIEFTNPTYARLNVSNCLKSGIPVICGTTGWNKELEEVKDLSHNLRVGFIHSSNFSIGMNIVFKVNKILANLLNNTKSYNPRITEIHHTQKLDQPSGTAITLAEHVIQNMDSVVDWSSNNKTDNLLNIESIRVENTPGIHRIYYQSDFDEIGLLHSAKSRQGFAIGTVLAAEFLYKKQGVYEMKDVMNSLMNEPINQV